MRKLILSLLLVISPALLAALPVKDALPLDKLRLPAGFSIAVYAEVPNARQMALGANGTVYVGSRRLGKVHAVLDANQDYIADKVIELDAGLVLPSGVAYRDGSLYVGAVSTVYQYHKIDRELASAKRTVLYDKLPSDNHHGWKFLKFGPDGLLYLPVGAPCNICLSDNPVYASILRMDVSAAKPLPEIVARGVRNSVGFDWHPVTGELWFTDNGRDQMGDDLPPCELNRVTKAGQHFGYPFFHGKDIPDPEFASRADKSTSYVPPALALGPHVAPLGMLFYTGNQLPVDYRNQALIAEHGSWNRTPAAGHTGHRVTLARITGNSLGYEVFIDGWLQDNEAWGRPVDLIQLPDGSLLLSDDKAGVIYRITYNQSK